MTTTKTMGTTGTTRVSIGCTFGTSGIDLKSGGHASDERTIQLLTPGRRRAVKGPIFEGTPAMGGKMLEFHTNGTNLGRPRYSVISKRGGFFMGTIEWSNQWGRARFKPDSEAVFDQTCIAEIYACMRDLK